MKQWSIGLMSNDEKRNILDQHKTLYNGFKTMQPKVSNEQPLYIQDFANDKGGVTVNNKGNVKAYTNVGINEQVEKESMCTECGGMMYEGECSECGYKGGEMGEEMQQVKDLKNVEDLNLSDKFDYTEEEMYEEEEITTDPNKETETQDPHQVGPSTDDGFGEYQDGDVYEDEEIGEQVGGGTAPYQNFSSIKPAYNFISGGPLEEEGHEHMDDGAELHPSFDTDGEFLGMSKKSEDMGDEWEEIDVIDDIDEKPFETMKSAWSDDEVSEQETEEQYLPIHVWKKMQRKKRADIEGEKFDDNELDMSDYDEFEPNTSSWEDITNMTGDDEFSHLDEDLKESVVKQKNKIMEMMNRMKGFN